MRFHYVRHSSLLEVGCTDGIKQMGDTYQKMVAVHGSPCSPTPLIHITVNIANVMSVYVYRAGNICLVNTRNHYVFLLEKLV
jgi:hypothetical protein